MVLKGPDSIKNLSFHSWRKHLQPDYTSAIVVNASLHLIMKRCRLSCFVHNHQLGPLRLSIVPTSKVQSIDSVRSGSLTEDASQDTANYANRKSIIHPLPAFSLLSNLEVLALEAVDAMEGPMHEITFSTDDKPKLLSQLTCLLSDMGLNIQEAHVFSTADGYSLNVFVVDGGPYEETEKLATAIEKEVCKRENAAWLGPLVSSLVRNEQTGMDSEVDHVPIPTDGSDVWEIDIQCRYRGTYRSQDVAIKVLKSERLDADLQREFAQEVSMMKKVRHRNVVQFIGACTKLPNLCIVTEFISGGSIYDFLHKHKGVFKLPTLLKVATDVSKGINYLHENNIIHRDLKAANILMDKNEKADVFSFWIMLWELLTEQGIRPTIPENSRHSLLS
ncbi:hypothetical protein SAY87_020859 [Trapa incisa]|uniref:ACT-like protein tyrosine kinase family protein n=1 Tax=Trapa incisa TaxID=236973 RepID=A0AAN7JR09_9MYRT|nr:hypothetical protein SAY87_020859 [Trapa incisa]